MDKFPNNGRKITKKYVITQKNMTSRCREVTFYTVWTVLYKLVGG